MAQISIIAIIIFLLIINMFILAMLFTKEKNLSNYEMLNIISNETIIIVILHYFSIKK